MANSNEKNCQNVRHKKWCRHVFKSACTFYYVPEEMGYFSCALGDKKTFNFSHLSNLWCFAFLCECLAQVACSCVQTNCAVVGSTFVLIKNVLGVANCCIVELPRKSVHRSGSAEDTSPWLRKFPLGVKFENVGHSGVYQERGVNSLRVQGCPLENMSDDHSLPHNFPAKCPSHCTCFAQF